MKPRIILSGGGTGGSVTPLLAVAPVLQTRGADLLFVGTDDGPEEKLVDAVGIPWRSIPAGKLRRYVSWKNIRDVGRTWQGYRAANRILAEWKPNVVVSAGSYVSVPLVWAAKRRGIHVLIHQQDVQPGLANRLMARAATSITTVLDDSRLYFPHGKTYVIGNPVRPEILTGSKDIALQRFGLEPGRPTILFIGGGTGSAALNQLVAEARPALSGSWNIIHTTGHHRGPVIVAEKNYYPAAFLTDDLPHALAAADIVVSRAGMGVLTELMALGKPSIILPMPHTHQEKNAAFLDHHQAAVVLEQEMTTAATLVTTIHDLWHNDGRRLDLSKRLHQLFHPEAVTTMADLILRLAQS